MMRAIWRSWLFPVGYAIGITGVVVAFEYLQHHSAKGATGSLAEILVPLGWILLLDVATLVVLVGNSPVSRPSLVAIAAACGLQSAAAMVSAMKLLATVSFPRPSSIPVWILAAMALALLALSVAAMLRFGRSFHKQPVPTGNAGALGKIFE